MIEFAHTKKASSCSASIAFRFTLFYRRVADIPARVVCFRFFFAGVATTTSGALLGVTVSKSEFESEPGGPFLLGIPNCSITIADSYVASKGLRQAPMTLIELKQERKNRISSGFFQPKKHFLY